MTAAVTPPGRPDDDLDRMVRLIHSIVDRRLERRTPVAPPLEVLRGTFVEAVAGTRTAKVLVDGSSTAVPAILPMLPEIPVAGDELLLLRRRDGWLVITDVLGRDVTVTSGGGTHPDLATHDALGLATDAELAAAIAAHAALTDPHTGYVLESLLTAQGDLPYATGTSAWARLAKGTAAQLLRMNAGATAPEWASLGATMESSATATTTMTTANTIYASGASLTLTEGVWDVHGDIEIASGANGTAFKASGLLYDGSAYIDERAGNSASVASAQGSISIHVKRFVTVTTGNTKTVTLRAVSTVNGTVIRNNALNNTQVNNRATTLSAVRIG